MRLFMMNTISAIQSCTFLMRAITALAFLSIGAGAMETIDTDSLRYSGEGSWRWLSMPDSRIVLNPYSKVVNGTPPSTDGLALHAGYFVGHGPTAVRLNNLIRMDEKTHGQVGKTWWPYKLELSASGNAEGKSIRTTDILADENTILRIMDFHPLLTNQDGRFPGLTGDIHGTCSLPSPDILVTTGNGWHAALCLATVSSIDECASAFLSMRIVDEKRWEAKIPASGQRFVLATIAFSLDSEGVDTAVQRARHALTKKPAAESIAKRKQEWDRLLGSVPHPSKLGIPMAEGVTPEVHRQWYYGAWTFLTSAIIAPLAENRYPHFSIAEGKPSLWAEGEPSAPGQCSWTCFMACGLLAGIMPDKAWSCYEGVMSKVNDEGILLGECLPSRKAQGAWLLYSATRDADRLARVYPAIKRYLIWRERNPRWIWGPKDTGHDIPDEKDCEFVVSHLIDLDYAIRIATVLGLHAEVASWKDMATRELANYRLWFFPDGEDPKNFYFTGIKSHVFKDRQEQKACYITTGLALHGMPSDLTERLQRYYLRIHNPDKPLCGFGYTKYGDTSFIAYGLTDRGMHPQAEQFIDRSLLDTMRPGADFGEVHELTKDGFAVAGVSPSLFLALQVIDFTLMRSGIRFDQGDPPSR